MPRVKADLHLCRPACTALYSPHHQVDPVFEGLSGGPGSLIKYNPLSNVTSAEVGWVLRRGMGWGIGVCRAGSQG